MAWAMRDEFQPSNRDACRVCPSKFHWTFRPWNVGVLVGAPVPNEEFSNTSSLCILHYTFETFRHSLATSC